MPKNFYTLLILPRKHSSAKKVSLSSTLVTGVSMFMMGLILIVMYFSYDYIHIRRDQAELKRLRQQTAAQRQQIDGLAAKVDQFAARMEGLKQFDTKIRIMANLETGRDRQQILGIGGPVNDQEWLSARMAEGDRSLIAAVDRQTDRLLEEADSRERSFANLLALLREKRSLLAATPSLWPVMGWVTSEFGRRSSPFGGETEFHKGLDIATKIGRAILAPATGVVKEAAYRHDVGQMIQIDHGHGISTFYGHLSKAVVRPGMTVRKGDRIGYVGNTGRSTGSHLHYAVLLNGVSVNPRKYLR